MGDYAQSGDLLIRDLSLKIKQIPIDKIIEVFHPLNFYATDSKDENEQIKHIEKKPLKELLKECPFQEKYPDGTNINPHSFRIDYEKNIYKCDLCDKVGKGAGFVMNANGRDFRDAIDLISSKFFNLKQGSLDNYFYKESRFSYNEFIDVYKDAVEFYFNILTQRENDDVKQAQHYLFSRLSPSSIKDWKLGYSLDDNSFLKTFQGRYPIGLLIESGLVRESQKNPGSYYDFFRNRIMIPINNGKGDAVSFAGRTNGKSDIKYINTPQTIVYNKSAIIFGLDKAEKSIREEKQAIVQEGYFDVMKSHEYGVKNTVCAGGIAVTSNQIMNLSRYCDEQIYCLDADEAGFRAAVKAAINALEKGVDFRILNLKQGDPCEFFEGKELKEGRKKYKNLVKKSVNIIDFAINIKGLKELKKPEEKHKCVKEIYEIVSASKNVLQKSLWLKHIAEELGLEEKILIEDYANHTRTSYNPRRSENEESFLGFLTTVPLYRRMCKKKFLKEDFSKKEYGLFFDFLCNTKNIDDLVLKPEISVDQDSLFAESDTMDLIKEFKNYCKDINEKLTKAQFNNLEGMLIRSLNNDEDIISNFEIEVFEKQLKKFEYKLKTLTKENNFKEIDKLTQVYSTAQHIYNNLIEAQKKKEEEENTQTITAGTYSGPPNEVFESEPNNVQELAKNEIDLEDTRIQEQMAKEVKNAGNSTSEPVDPGFMDTDAPGFEHEFADENNNNNNTNHINSNPQHDIESFTAGKYKWPSKEVFKEIFEMYEDEYNFEEEEKELDADDYSYLDDEINEGEFYLTGEPIKELVERERENNKNHNFGENDIGEDDIPF